MILHTTKDLKVNEGIIDRTNVMGKMSMKNIIINRKNNIIFPRKGMNKIIIKLCTYGKLFDYGLLNLVHPIQYEAVGAT